MTVERIAQVVHEANRALQAVLGEPVDPHWEDPTCTWQKDSTIRAVQEIINVGFDAKGQHESWMRERLEQGWVYGPVKNANASPKTNPALVAYDELPAAQRVKDTLRNSITVALAEIEPQAALRGAA